MKNKTCLSTRTDRHCPQCGEEFLLAEPTDVLAMRPIQVDLVCPRCNFPGRATLTGANTFQSVYPNPRAYAPLELVPTSLHPAPRILS